MRAAVLEEAPGGLHLEEIPIPEPLDGEVLVKVTACGVCHTDLHVMKAEVAFPTPAVLGHEISGEAIEPRNRRRRSSAGHGVASRSSPCGRCRPCAIGRDDLCDNFFAMNRLRGTLYDGTTRLRPRTGRRWRCARWPGSPSARWFRDRHLPLRRLPLPNRLCWAARCSRRTAPSATARICAAANGWRRGGRRRGYHPDCGGVRRVAIIAVDVRDDKLRSPAAGDRCRQFDEGERDRAGA
jgi:hypothetical protein